MINNEKVFKDNASKEHMDIFRRIAKEKRENIAHSMGYDMINTIKKGVKNKSEAEISNFISFVIDEWKIAKQEEEEETKKDKKSK